MEKRTESRQIVARPACSGAAGMHGRPEVSSAVPRRLRLLYKESPTQFKETDGWKVAQPDQGMLRGKWWEIFKDPELNALEEQLNIDNQNIKQAFENFMVARALIREARAQYFPTIGVSRPTAGPLLQGPCRAPAQPAEPPG